MAVEKPSTDGFLAVLDAKIAALKALAESYRTALSLGALGPGDLDVAVLDANQGGGKGGAAYELPTGAMLGMSIPSAVKLYLGAVKKKQTAREIATALQEGGVESTAASFENTVTGALHRLKANGEVLRFKDGWALAELYPANLRNRIEEKAAPKKKPAKKARKARAPQTTQAKRDQNAVLAATDDKTAVIYQNLSPNNGATPQELHALLEAMKLPCGMNYVYAVLHRLNKQGKAEKHSDGKWYRANERATSAA